MAAMQNISLDLWRIICDKIPIETLIKEKQQMTKVTANPIGLFHTPESMEELQKWIESTKDPLVATGAYMMWNLLSSKYEFTEK